MTGTTLDVLQKQAARCFVMGHEARQAGNHDLADILVKAACRYLDRIHEIEQGIHSAPQAGSTLQQQQIQPK